MPFIQSSNLYTICEENIHFYSYVEFMNFIQEKIKNKNIDYNALLLLVSLSFMNANYSIPLYILKKIHQELPKSEKDDPRIEINISHLIDYKLININNKLITIPNHIQKHCRYFYICVIYNKNTLIFDILFKIITNSNIEVQHKIAISNYYYKLYFKNPHIDYAIFLYYIGLDYIRYINDKKIAMQYFHISKSIFKKFVYDSRAIQFCYLIDNFQLQILKKL